MQGSTEHPLGVPRKYWNKYGTILKYRKKLQIYLEYRENFCPAIRNIWVISVRWQPPVYTYIFFSFL
jgi:hypothetical protein